MLLLWLFDDRCNTRATPLKDATTKNDQELVVGNSSRPIPNNTWILIQTSSIAFKIVQPVSDFVRMKNSNIGKIIKMAHSHICICALIFLRTIFFTLIFLHSICFWPLCTNSKYFLRTDFIFALIFYALFFFCALFFFHTKFLIFFLAIFITLAH